MSSSSLSPLIRPLILILFHSICSSYSHHLFSPSSSLSTIYLYFTSSFASLSHLCLFPFHPSSSFISSSAPPPSASFPLASVPPFITLAHHCLLHPQGLWRRDSWLGVDGGPQERWRSVWEEWALQREPEGASVLSIYLLRVLSSSVQVISELKAYSNFCPPLAALLYYLLWFLTSFSFSSSSINSCPFAESQHRDRDTPQLRETCASRRQPRHPRPRNWPQLRQPPRPWVRHTLHSWWRGWQLHHVRKVRQADEGKERDAWESLLGPMGGELKVFELLGM